MKSYLTIFFFLIQTTGFSQIELLKFDAINLCDSVEVVKSKVRLNLHSIDYYKDSLRLKVRLIENCGLYHKQGAIISRNDTLILMWTNNNRTIYGKDVVSENRTWFSKDSLIRSIETSCNCYIEISYTIKDIKEVNHIQVYNKNVVEKDSMYRLYEPTFKIYEGDTINYTDTLGIKKGKWMEFDSLGRVLEIKIESGIHYRVHYEKFEYHNNGEIAVHYLTSESKNAFSMIEKYYENGQIKERYFAYHPYLDGNDYLNLVYEEHFDESGKLIKRELLDIDNNLYEYGYFYE